VCHAFLNDPSFYQFLFSIDQDLAQQVKRQGCACGGVLHSACYPRKPRGVARSLLGPTYQIRLSFCCAQDGCRRRHTPPSVRFLGRRVYLGVIIVLITAMTHGLTEKRRQALIKALHLNSQTLYRWRKFWRECFPVSRCWQALQGQFIPPLAVTDLPGAWLGRFTGKDLRIRIGQLLRALIPLTSVCCADFLQGVMNPQNEVIPADIRSL